jgi:guanylate kinase
MLTAESEIMLYDKFDYVINSKSKDEDYSSLMSIYRKHSTLIKN